MAFCTGCGITTDAQGRLSLDYACTMNDLFTCVENITGDPMGQTSGWGSNQQWPKRFDTHLVNDPGNQGFPDYGADNTDDPTFIGNPVRELTEDFTIPCGTANPGYVSSDNVIISENALEVKNDWDIPVIFEVQTSGWYHDMVVPQRDDGGARWLGEARVRISNDEGSSWQDMQWQRASELAMVFGPNPNYVYDAHNVAEAFGDVSDVTIGAVQSLMTCMETLADAVEAMRCGDGQTGDANPIRQCLTATEGLLGLTEDRLEELAKRILDADRGINCNPAYLDRRVETHGSWQHAILVQPGQTIRVETRSKFAHWSNGACQTPVGEFCMCQARGAARSGKITMVANPVYGGANCNPVTRYGQPWWDSSLDNGNHGTDGN